MMVDDKHSEDNHTLNSPTEIPKKCWKSILFRIKGQLTYNHISIVAAGVTFYSFLAIFPAIAAIISIYGLAVDAETVQLQLDQLTSALPEQAHALLSTQLSELANRSPSTLSIGALVSFLLAIWSAKKGANAVIEGIDIAYGSKSSRSYVHKTLLTLVFTAGGILLAIACSALVVGLPAALTTLNLSEPMDLTLRVIRWGVLAGILLISLAIIYRYAPSRPTPQWRWVTPGAVVAICLWLLASSAFSYYVSHFNSYNKTYGSLAAVVILQMWTFVSSYIVLLGAEINSEMERQTIIQTEDGHQKCELVDS
ncbi:YihY/virulence factor BrkB family protein [Gilvimarinus agarilyticus]|uniref:YihY/virulence factor BrkB family protein n=1 Tax=Gilvimarinus sp. 2_MG-2023 TaxID=3062666 RepID=UPI001C08BC4D|nr:YihY/virulence factor BrkB family protein [Gilvimarinus sp. 2_MG-2023]MBU2886696.1 YihY/virulence factor BrkB family protein [Gilvimarinus agarilyticus]MDO6571363.1 YihY/virulence factor BrkB family protein [Gilvimarinus sp. 2_MG-2023]